MLDRIAGYPGDYGVAGSSRWSELPAGMVTDAAGPTAAILP